MVRKGIKNLISVFLCVCVSACVFSLCTVNVSAIAYPCKGEISKATAEVWSHPGTAGHEAEGSEKSEQLDTLKLGAAVTIVGDGVDGDGDRWYQINYGDAPQKSGYVYSGRVKIIAVYEGDEEFEKWLTGQNFPESYKPGLRLLHSLYPNWVFYADHTGVKFEDAVLNENLGSGKFVGVGEDDSLKSMENGYYDFATGKYTYTEGTKWVKCSKQTLAYYIDPRNFFDAKSVFMFLKQSYDPEKGTATAEDIEKVAKGTFMAGKIEEDGEKTYAEVILEAAKEFKMNPYVIVGLIRQEQGTKGTSSLIAGLGTKNAKGETVYQGYYNYFNVGAYPSGNMDAAERGLWWAAGAGHDYTTYGRPWNTREKAVKGGVEFSVNNYISVGQDTFYYMNFNVCKNTKYATYSHQYASNVEDSVGKGKGMASAYADVNDVAVEFSIPVFLDMPDKTSLPPEKTNNDCYLSALTVKDFEIATFNRYKNSYELVVPYETTEVEITAVKSNAAAVVSGGGKVPLKVGTNTVDITVTSSSGLKNIYTLTVAREEGQAIKEPTLHTEYKIGDYLTGVAPDTSLENFIKNLGVEDGTAKIIAKSGSEKKSGLIATGDTVYIYDSGGAESVFYKVVIYGDINNDGKVTSVDLLVAQRHILRIKLLDAPEQEAADTDHDFSIKSVDLLVAQRHILQIKSILQTR